MHMQKLVRWTVAYSKALMLYSRQQSDAGAVRRVLSGVLYPYEMRQLERASPNYPQFVLQVLSSIIEKARLGEYREDKMLKNLDGEAHAACTACTHAGTCICLHAACTADTSPGRVFQGACNASMHAPPHGWPALHCTAVFYEAVGTCERIVRFPIPLSYTRHTSRFMLLWLALLPIALYDEAK